MIPDREFASAEDLAAHYKAVRARLGLVTKAPTVSLPAPAPAPAPAVKPPPPKRLRAPADEEDARRSAEAIIARIAAVHGVTPQDIRSYSKNPQIVTARGDAIAAVWKAKPKLRSLPWLGKLFARNHATIFWWLQKAGLKAATVKGKPRSVPHRLTSDQQLAACELYRSGLTLQRIGERFSVSSGCIHRILKRYGIVMRLRAPPTILTIEQQLVVCDLYRRGLSSRKIGAQYEVSPGCIWSVLARHGVTMRPTSQATLTTEQQLAACELYDLGLSTRDLSALFGLHRKSITSTLKRRGVVLRAPNAVPSRKSIMEVRHAG